MDSVNYDIQENIWLKMLRDYLSDTSISYQKLSLKYNVPLRTIEAHGAAEQWPRLRADVIVQAVNRIKEQAVDELTEYKKKMIRLGRLISSKALKRLVENDLEPQTARDALSYLIEGLKMEGLGLGFSSKPDQIQNNFVGVQQNSLPIPVIYWGNEPMPPYRKPIETFEEEQAWLREEELKKQHEQSLSS